MPNKLTDTEIKKALECCANLEACEKCPMASLQKYDSDTCEHQIMLYALELINRQEGENEKNENIIRIADKTIATLNAENETLKAEVERLKAKANHYNYCYENFVNTPISRIKAEAYKEFAERLKEKYTNPKLGQWNFEKAFIKQIDNFLKELVGEHNSTNIDKQN